MDIVELAEKYAREHAPTRVDGNVIEDRLRRQFMEWLRDAYLAGSGQTQRDYVAHYEGNAGHG